MNLSRRSLLGAFAAGGLSAATDLGAKARDRFPSAEKQVVPPAVPPGAAGKSEAVPARRYDLREDLKPRRLTMAMWDEAYALRHTAGESMAAPGMVLDEAVERAYNTLRLDPMPQWIDLRNPQRVLKWPDPHQPLMPWLWNKEVEGPVGKWVIEFVEQLLRRPSLHYTLSAWWFMPGVPDTPPVPEPLRRPASLAEGAEMWVTQLRDWQRRFGFERLLYVDIANETPYFFPGILARLETATGTPFGAGPRLTSAQVDFLAQEINGALALLRGEFPELRFTTSLHADSRWLDVPLELDCLDVHFFADMDARWSQRTRFNEFLGDHLFETDRWFAEFSERATKTSVAVAPMLRAKQRRKMQEFANWAGHLGAPITTSEAWASWYYVDHPKLDWGWLLDWSTHACDDAIDCGFWGWTPHNYAAPQFANWKDVNWHRTLNERFLNG